MKIFSALTYQYIEMCPQGSLDSSTGQQQTPEDSEQQNVTIGEPRQQESGKSSNETTNLIVTRYQIFGFT